MYAWEKPFAKFLDAVRSMELKKIKITAYVRAVNMAFLVLPCRVLVFFSILASFLLGSMVQPQKLYLLTMHLNFVQLTVAYYFPFSCSLFGEVAVTLDRIEVCIPMSYRNSDH